jgi:two-component system, cell cycle sensor histidine kinase and response regulator CckA
MATSANVEPRSSGGETILLVEDEDFVRGVTQAVLQSAGYSVLAVRDAIEAQRTYEQHSGRMNLLLTDIVLPGEDGRQLAQRLSKMNSALQILLVTGYSKETDRNYLGEEQERERDDDCILRKPFAASILLRKVRELLDRRQA